MSNTLSLNDYLLSHCSASMEQALAAERYPVWQRVCPGMSDIDFIRLGLLRCISPVDSGRHFIQTSEEVHGEHLPHSTYFKALKSSRRTRMLEAIECQSYNMLCNQLAALEIDYLKSFPELDEYTVEAADGHFIDHACHTPRGSNGKVYAAGFIYAINLRNGLLRPLCCITNGTNRHHELPILRNHINDQNSHCSQSEKNLYVYDKAVTDFSWWAKQKAHQNYMISVLKENSVATWIKSIDFDGNNPTNTGIEAYSIYENQGIRFNLVDYRDPETQKLHRFVSTLPESINPGTIAVLYYKRWSIEKAYNNSKSNLKEKKAWSSSVKSLNNQMRLTTMTYNLMRVCEEISKTQDPELIHPSDKKYNQALEERQKRAQKKGGFVNPLLFLERITRISSYTIRAVQNAIITGKSLADLMFVLMARLVPV